MKFDVLSITHAVSMEQLNFVACLYDSGIPLFKQQRLEREDVPIIIVGGANSGTTAPLHGEIELLGKKYSCFIDGVVYGDGEEAAKQLIECVKEGKLKGLTKREMLRSFHGKVEGWYEPDLYDHEYDGKGKIVSIKPNVDYAEFPVNRATVIEHPFHSYTSLTGSAPSFFAVSLSSSANCSPITTSDNSLFSTALTSRSIKSSPFIFSISLISTVFS